jgi:hypothetical protein
MAISRWRRQIGFGRNKGLSDAESGRGSGPEPGDSVGRSEPSARENAGKQ